MHYKYDVLTDYSDFASGRVFYNAKSVTNFPVRLANEIFNRCLQHSVKKNKLTVYDPCCGGAYLLASLAFLNFTWISKLIGSDVDKASLELAYKNVSLLQTEKLHKRRDEIETLYNLYNKESHSKALQSVDALQKYIDNNHKIKTSLFTADMRDLSKEQLSSVDILLADVPYGNMVNWKGADENGLQRFLDSLYRSCNYKTIIAVIYTRDQKIDRLSFQRLEKFKAGKRIVQIVKKGA